MELIVAKKKNNRVFDFYPLEDRVLLSGEGTEGLGDLQDADADLTDALMNDGVDSDGDGHADISSADLIPAGEAQHANDHDYQIDAPIDAPTFDPALPLEVIFVDAGVENADVLLDDLRSGSEDTQWLIVRLSANEDGVSQITKTLDGMSGVDAIHILSHGDGEGLQLGNQNLTSESAPDYAGDIASWGFALDSDADILIYGCDLASTDAGQDLIEMIAIVCDCDVAASDDATGAADLGGDWILEYTVGDVQTEVAFGYLAQASWHDTLATFTVTRFDDVTDFGDGQLSLREAITLANGNSEADTIVLGTGTYTITIAGISENANATGDLDISSDITIQGDGAQDSFIDGTMIDRIFDVDSSGDLALQGLTLQNGVTQSGSGQAGGAVNVDGGTLQATDVVFSNNQASTNGGAIFANGDVTLDRVALVNNVSGNVGGGIFVLGSSTNVTINNTTISGNTSASGGGIQNNGGILTIDHSTIADNDASNSSGGGVRLIGGTNTFSNSIFADNTSVSGGNDINGTFVSGGYNIIEDGDTANFSGNVGTDILNADPGLSALTLDGDTYVHTIDATSNAYNAASGSSETVDQRGFARDGNPDIGAYEFGAPAGGGSPTELTVDTISDTVDGTTTDVASLLADKGADGFISLREAIIASNNDSTSGWTINLGAGTFTLSIGGSDDTSAGGDLDILSDITIVGAGRDSTTIDADGIDRVFDVLSGGIFALLDATITGGNTTQVGAGLSVASGAIASLTRVAVTGNNTTSSGGGFSNNGGTLNIQSSIISGNTASLRGAGGQNNQGNTTIKQSAIFNNTAGTYGGALYGLDGSMTIENSTISGNTAANGGGGVQTYGENAVSFTHSTIANNTATSGSGGGFFAYSGTNHVESSIFADNNSVGTGNDVKGVIFSDGYNIIEDTSGYITSAGDDSADDITGVDPTLNALALVDGTYVHTFDTTSVAYNAAAASTETVDQRGSARDGNPDIGAYESDATPIVITDITVDTTLDKVDGDTTSVASLLADKGTDGFVSLREAIIAVNNDTNSGWTIILGAGTYDLSITGSGDEAGDLDITSDVTIVGVDAESSIIDGDMAERLFQVQTDASLTLEGLTIQGGSDGTGGAIRVTGGSLQATDVIFKDNHASTIGGAIYIVGDATLDRVAVINNESDSQAGAILVGAGTTTITNSTISGNMADNGAGIQVISGGTLTIDHSTIASNTATSTGGGLRVVSGNVTVSNSIFADNSGTSTGQDVAGTITSGGYNIIEDATGFTGDVATDILGFDPGLNPLSLVDGTYVHTFDTSSIAYNAATASTQTVDQRGVARDGSPDIGAYELILPDLVTTASNGGGLSINDDGGDDAYVIADDSSALVGGRDTLSYEVQFAISRNFGITTLLSYAITGQSNEVFFRIDPSGNLRLSLGGNSVSVSNSTFDFNTLRDGNEHTLGFTWNGQSGANGAWELFADGASVGSGTGLNSGGTIETGGALLIGQEQDSVEGGFDPTQGFQGTLYDARFLLDRPNGRRNRCQLSQ